LKYVKFKLDCYDYLSEVNH